MLVHCDSNQTAKILKRMCEKIEDEEPITAVGLFRVDRSMLASLAGNVLTYLIILVQFNTESHPSSYGTCEA